MFQMEGAVKELKESGQRPLTKQMQSAALCQYIRAPLCGHWSSNWSTAWPIGHPCFSTPTATDQNWSFSPKLYGLATMDCQCCGRQNKRNWTKTAHHTHINVHLGTVQTHTQRCAVTGWTLGLMEASARGGRVIGYPPSANNRSTHNSLHNLVVCVDKNIKSVFDINRFTVSCNAAARTVITHHRLNSDSSKTPDVHMTATN